MIRFVSVACLLVLTVSTFRGTPVIAGSGPVRPRSLITRPILQPQISSTPQISGRAAVRAGRERRGVTIGTGTTPFPAGLMHGRPEGFLTNTRKLGDNTVVTSGARIGVTRSVSTDKFGVSSSTRAPVTVGRSGLSTLHSTGSSWSGFKRVK